MRRLMVSRIETWTYGSGLAACLLVGFVFATSSCSPPRGATPPVPPPPSQIPGNAPPQEVEPSTAEKRDGVERQRLAPARETQYSPFVGRAFPTQAYFGDLHVHTKESVDAGLAGATIGPEQAYRFARGEEVVSQSGARVKLVRPLDFVAIADHAENLGLVDFIERSDFRLIRDQTGRRWHDLFHAGKSYDVFAEWSRAKNTDPISVPELGRVAWKRAISVAERFYEPRAFSTFAAYEWTSEPDGNCLHRVVLFRDAPNKTESVLPFSRYDSARPEDLWLSLEKYEQEKKGRVLSIPHNGNLSNGLMFDEMTSEGRTIQPDDANRRRHFEPVYEVTQMKGDGETHPKLSPDDEFADFETIDRTNAASKAPKTDRMLPGEYARSALLSGLKLERSRGQNPFQFGLVGGTDSHNGLSTSREDNYFGVAPMAEPSRARLARVFRAGDRPELSLHVWELSASGLTGIWAIENTREALFDALSRREVFATTGSRMKVRVFAGYAFRKEDLFDPDLARIGYAKGVPMGGELFNAPHGQSLRFLVQAERDPQGANLDRIQVIKGTLGAAGETRERVFDVAVSGGRRIDAHGHCRQAVGSTVDLERATYENSIGAPLLEAFFEDPEFDEKSPAFYYVRVLEIPKPRWTAYDQKVFHNEAPEGAAVVIQDRAYSSPIWYLPER